MSRLRYPTLGVGEGMFLVAEARERQMTASRVEDTQLEPTNFSCPIAFQPQDKTVLA